MSSNCGRTNDFARLKLISNYLQLSTAIFTWETFPTANNNSKLAIQLVSGNWRQPEQLVVSNNFPLERIHETVSRRLQLRR